MLKQEFETPLRSVGEAAKISRPDLTLFDRVAWILYWEKSWLATTVAGGLIWYTAFSSALGILIAATAALLGFRGRTLVTKNWRESMMEIEARVRQVGAERAGVAGQGVQCIVVPSARTATQPERLSYLSGFFVADAFVSIYSGSQLDLARLAMRLSENVPEDIYFKNLQAVDYRKPFLEMTLSGGAVRRFEMPPADGEVVFGLVRGKLRSMAAAGSHNPPSFNIAVVNNVGSNANQTDPAFRAQPAALVHEPGGFCAACGSRMEANAVYCGTCGRRRAEGQASIEKPGLADAVRP